MSFCNKCKVEVIGNRQLCPLCQAELKGKAAEAQPDIFPYVPTLYRKHNLFFRILMLLSVATVVICFTINALIPYTGWWSWTVAGGIVSFWVSLLFAVRKRHNVPKAVLYQTVLLSALAAGWDYFTGWHGWALDFVIPFVCVGALIALAATAKIIQLSAPQAAIYFTIAAVFGIVPLVFLMKGLVAIRLPSLICVAASAITLAALLIFQLENVGSALKRRLHM